jgi:hypothetical protein
MHAVRLDQGDALVEVRLEAGLGRDRAEHKIELDAHDVRVALQFRDPCSGHDPSKGRDRLKSPRELKILWGQLAQDALDPLSDLLDPQSRGVRQSDDDASGAMRLNLLKHLRVNGGGGLGRTESNEHNS